MSQTKEPIFLPIKAAAKKVGLPYRVLLEAVNDGAVPHYRLGSSRRLLRVEEVIACMHSNPYGTRAYSVSRSP